MLARADQTPRQVQEEAGVSRVRALEVEPIELIVTCRFVYPTAIVCHSRRPRSGHRRNGTNPTQLTPLQRLVSARSGIARNSAVSDPQNPTRFRSFDTAVDNDVGLQCGCVPATIVVGVRDNHFQRADVQRRPLHPAGESCASSESGSNWHQQALRRRSVGADTPACQDKESRRRLGLVARDLRKLRKCRTPSASVVGIVPATRGDRSQEIHAHNWRSVRTRRRRRLIGFEAHTGKQQARRGGT